MRVPWIGALIILGSVSSYAQTWLPRKAGSTNEVVTRTAYTLSYDDPHEVAAWVGYSLRPEHLRDCVGRSPKFFVDPDLRAGSATPEDYRGSGFDRGHLAPAGDMKWSAAAMRESFYYSNITPQRPGMNRGKWMQLETLVRAWAKSHDEVIVITGPVLNDVTQEIGHSRVAVPAQHFKVLLATKGGVRKAIAFLMGQSPSDRDLITYALPVRAIEQLTGWDFFPHLSRREQDRLEETLAPRAWDYRATFSYSPCRSR